MAFLRDESIERLLFDAEGLLESGDESHLFAGEDSDNDPDYLEEKSDSESEQSAEEEESEEPHSTKRVTVLKGKSGYKWSTVAPERRGRHKMRNLVTHLPGPKGEARNITTPLEAWSLLLSDDILEKVVAHTNEQITRCSSTTTTPQTYQGKIDIIELKAFIGLSYLAGVRKAAKLHLNELWSARFGVSIFRATMSLHRYEFIGTCLRFDDKTTRAERKVDDKFAPIREIWDAFITNCKSLYTPFEYCTIDEQLMDYRGNCPFRIYMASKPDKYGIKFVMMNDARTWYMINAIPYVGKVNVAANESVPSYYVKKLSASIHGTGRNLTVDNWFSSVPLFQTMLTEFNLTMLGTLRKNKREIPPQFLARKEEGTSQFAFDENKTLVSFAPKKK